MVFDCLQARGKDLRSQPLYVRRNVIEDVLDEQDMVLPVRRLADDGLKAWQQVLRARLRGPGRQGPGIALPRRAHAQVAEGEAASLSRGGARVGGKEVGY
jgi:hypothetical protein